MAKIILGLAGEMASGKGTAAQYLSEHKGASVHRFSTMLRDVLTRIHLPQTRENIQKLSKILRDTYGQDTFARVIAEDVAADTSAMVIVDGVRRESDIVHLRKNPAFRLVFIDTDLRTRFDRITQRSENVDDHGKTFAQFVQESKADAEIQIAALKDIADDVINNNGTHDDLHQQIDAIVDAL